MDFLQPTSWADALAVQAQRPDAVAIAGGTDVMVDLNFDRRRPGALLDLGRVAELREWSVDGDIGGAGGGSIGGAGGGSIGGGGGGGLGRAGAGGPHAPGGGRRGGPA